MNGNAGAGPNVAATLGVGSVLLAPFAFGAVNFSAWIPLSWLWIGIGTVAFLASRKPGGPRLAGLPAGLKALHLLFALQLLPLPASWLQVISPGSFAAHFIPPPSARTWAPLTASPTGTLQAWLFVIGLHALALAIFSGDVESRLKRTRYLMLGMTGVGGVLALVGLVQSKSAHPYWLYGVFEVRGAGAHERGIFGPYYNRDHYANLLAIAASVATALFSASVSRSRSWGLRTFWQSADFAKQMALLVAILLMVVAIAASGSRGGLVAMAAGLAGGCLSLVMARPRLGLGAAILLVAVLFGTGVPEAFMRMADVDFEESRLMVWRDAMRLIEFFPIFGCGIGAFAPAYWPYQRVVRFEYWPHLHNEYGQWVLEGGLLGVLLSAYVLRHAWIAAPGVIKNLENRPALAGLAAALTHAVVEGGFRVPANAAWAGLLVVCLAAPPRSVGLVGPMENGAARPTRRR